MRKNYNNNDKRHIYEKRNNKQITKALYETVVSKTKTLKTSHLCRVKGI